MNLKISISSKKVAWIAGIFYLMPLQKLVVLFSILFSMIAVVLSYKYDVIIAYGDAESHLNIAKRVVTSLTPGLAQLGGIWLPIPHLLMAPFVASDFLWRTGLAGSIVSAVAFVISSLYLYKLTLLVTKNKWASFVSSSIFMTNLNALYMQSTPMTELPLIVFFILSTYYFFQYMLKRTFIPLILAAIFALLASLSRYDGWFLVVFEIVAIFLLNLDLKKISDTFITRLEGELFLFGTVAVVGTIGWFTWGYLILGDPFYFINSPFSAKSQQHNWLFKHELPGYHNIFQSFLYYLVTSMSVVGIVVFLMAVTGLLVYLVKNRSRIGLLLLFVLSAPFVFNVFTLFQGQSVIFIPDLTPSNFEWRLFNVRYGLMMVPAIAFLMGFLFSKVKNFGKWTIIILFLVNTGLFAIGYVPIVTLADGTIGLSEAKRTDAELWLSKHYDKGLIMIDDYARTTSVIRSNIPMQNVVYIGSRGYWQEALLAPQLRIKWIVMQRSDSLWNAFYSTPEKQGRLYKYYQKAYTSKDILIFERARN